MEYVEILSRLVACHTASSVDPRLNEGNRDLIGFAADLLELNGFMVRLVEAPDDKLCLFARLGAGPGGLLLCGHSDTVPADPAAWSTDPHTLTQRDGRLYGLGACDMKGFIAAALSLAQRVSEPPRPLSIAITSDEETSMAGVRALVAELEGAESPSLVVVGEPTSLVPIAAHKGYLAGEITVRGRAGHSSNPAAGANAILACPGLIGRLEGVAHALMARRDPRFGVPYTTLNLGTIHGGDIENRICDEVRLTFDARPTGVVGCDEVWEMVSMAVTAPLEGGCSASVRPLYPDIEPFASPDPGLLRRLEEGSGCAARCVDYCTEASFLKRLGPCVVMGPGDIAHAHQPDEFLPLADVERLMPLLERLFGEHCMAS
ncbi:MAG: acetylornithine deacetylase [Succinivibrionaceae bacterium]|nr:acetylornithine deacetylase [Succinivibrionaceae bacterium]